MTRYFRTVLRHDTGIRTVLAAPYTRGLSCPFTENYYIKPFSVRACLINGILEPYALYQHKGLNMTEERESNNYICVFPAK